MKRIFALTLALSLILPFPLGAQDLDLDFKPVEKDILERERMEQEMEERKGLMAEEKGGAGKWLYMLLGVGLIAAAAGGGGGGGGGSSAPTADVTISW